MAIWQHIPHCLSYSTKVTLVAACLVLLVHLAPVNSAFTLVSSQQNRTQEDTELQRNIRAAPSRYERQRRWPRNTVYYQIDDSLLSEKRSIERAMRHIESVTCIRYVRASGREPDIVRIENSTGCFDPVGRQGGLQNIFISIPECGFYGFYIHTCMQVLGFHHEHQRFDRDAYVDIFPENVQTQWLWAFEKLNATNHFFNRQYDLDSIMQYGSYQFSRNGRPTVLRKDGGLIESWVNKTRLSVLDRRAINEYYNCPRRNQYQNWT